MQQDTTDVRESYSTAGRLVRVVLDAVAYALTTTAIVFVGGFLVGVVFGGGVVTAKYVLFVVGILLFGYGALQMQPSKPIKTEKSLDGTVEVKRRDQDEDDDGRGEDETRLQAFVQRVPPVSWYPLAPAERLSGGTKVFLASLVMLALSFGLEVVFSVQL